LAANKVLHFEPDSVIIGYLNFRLFTGNTYWRWRQCYVWYNTTLTHVFVSLFAIAQLDLRRHEEVILHQKLSTPEVAVGSGKKIHKVFSEAH